MLTFELTAMYPKIKYFLYWPIKELICWKNRYFVWKSTKKTFIGHKSLSNEHLLEEVLKSQKWSWISKLLTYLKNMRRNEVLEAEPYRVKIWFSGIIHKHCRFFFIQSCLKQAFYLWLFIIFYLWLMKIFSF